MTGFITNNFKILINQESIRNKTSVIFIKLINLRFKLGCIAAVRNFVKFRYDSLQVGESRLEFRQQADRLSIATILPRLMYGTEPCDAGRVILMVIAVRVYSSAPDLEQLAFAMRYVPRSLSLGHDLPRGSVIP